MWFGVGNSARNPGYRIASAVKRERSQCDILHVQFAVFLYGGFMSALSFPVFLLYMKLSKVPVVVTLHQAVPVNQIDHKFQEETGIKGNLRLLKFGLTSLLRMVMALSSQTIVHENLFRDVLVSQYQGKAAKIKVVAHGMDDHKEPIPQELARDILGIKPGSFVVLFFGYLAKYKGLDSLMEAFNALPEKDCLLVVAGGEHPRLKGRKDYDGYLAELRRKAVAAGERIMFTGFVKEAEIPLVFGAADVTIFPYTRAISSSGPFALSCAYQKPILASEELEAIIEEPDILFRNEPLAIKNKILQFKNNGQTQEKSFRYIKALQRQRRWSEVARQTLNVYRTLVPERAYETIPASAVPALEMVGCSSIGVGCTMNSGSSLLEASLTGEGNRIL